jgi:hypothetical protein
MSGEVSYFSRFFVKFVEIIAAGLASAISAFLLAHFWGLLLSSPTPVSAPAQTAVQVGPTASKVTEGLRAQPTPPVAAAAVAAVAQPAKKAGKDAKASPPRKPTKTDTSVAEKEPRGQNSAEALIRAAIANVDANRPAPADALMGPGLTDTRSAPVDVQPRHVVPRQVVPRLDVLPRAAQCRVACRRRSAAAGAAPSSDRRRPAAPFPRPGHRRLAAAECQPAARGSHAPAAACGRPGQGRVLRLRADPRSAAPRPAAGYRRNPASAHAGWDVVA